MCLENGQLCLIVSAESLRITKSRCITFTLVTNFSDRHLSGPIISQPLQGWKGRDIPDTEVQRIYRKWLLIQVLSAPLRDDIVQKLGEYQQPLVLG